MLSNIQLDKVNVNNAKWIIQNDDPRFARKTKKLTYHMWQISYWMMCSKRDSNSHGHFCPKDFKSFVSTIPPFERLERKTRLELATPTLARLCSTNWAISAIICALAEMRCKGTTFFITTKYLTIKMQQKRYNWGRNAEILLLKTRFYAFEVTLHNLCIR